MSSSFGFIGEAEEGKIPFRMLGHLMTVEIRIDDSPKDFHFVVDTGGRTFVAKAVADDLGLKQMGPQAKINTLHLEGMDIENIFCFTTFDFSHLNSLGTPIHGIIGSDLMERFRVTFDFKTRRITFADGTEPLEKPDSAALLKFENHRINNAPLVEFKVNDKPLKGMIDTGQPHALVLPLETFESYGPEDFSGIIQSRGLMAKWPNTRNDYNYLVRVKAVHVGNRDYPLVSCLFGELPRVLSMPLLGMDFLALFTIIIDFPNDEIFLIPRDGLSLKANIFSVGLNAGLSEDEVVVVEGLWEGSPADKAGLEVGDKILSYKGVPLRADNLLGLQDALRDERIETIVLEISRGDSRRRVVLGKDMLF